MTRAFAPWASDIRSISRGFLTLALSCGFVASCAGGAGGSASGGGSGRGAAASGGQVGGGATGGTSVGSGGAGPATGGTTGGGGSPTSSGGSGGPGATTGGAGGGGRGGTGGAAAGTGGMGGPAGGAVGTGGRGGMVGSSGGAGAVGGAAGGGSSGIKVTVDASGKYTVTFTRPAWTFGGDLGAPAMTIATATGSDRVGPYHETTFSYSRSGARNGRIRAYDQVPVVVFGETNPAAASNIRNFPRLSTLPTTAYHLAYTSVQFAPYSYSELTPESPWVFFDSSANTFILSGASHFVNVENRQESGGAVSTGISAQIANLPAGFEQTAVLAADAGINRTYDAWGSTLLKLGGKVAVANDASPDLEYFGYWTDHGGTYYYSTEAGADYQKTLKDVRAYFQQQGIPIGYVQLDSWWYPKGAKGDWQGDGTTDRGGIYTYTADKTLFPSGLPSFQQSLGLPLITHSRWIDPGSPYRSMYRMSNDVSTDLTYWTMIASYLKTGGVATYEQDWMRKEALPVTSNLTDQDAFLDNMAQAMKTANISMQYCMALPRHFLQSTKYQNLVTIRVSEDRFDRNRWRVFFHGSRLAAALGIWPWTDVFKSSERDNLLVATLSGGIVGVGDAIGSADKASIQRAMRADGVLIKPDTALLLLDRSFIGEAQGKTSPTIAAARSIHAGGTTTYVFGFTDSSASMSFTPAELGYTGSVYVFDVNHSTGRVLTADQANADTVTNTAYYVVAPIGKSGMAFLGEQGKLASVGKKRIGTWSDEGVLKVAVLFAAGETSVKLHGYAPSAPTVTANSGTATVQYDSTSKRFTVTVAPTGTSAALTLQL